MSEDESPGIKAGSVVWFTPERLRSYPEWPGKVVEIHSGTAVVEAFGDRETYDRKVEQLVPLATEYSSFIASGKKKLKHKTAKLELFMSSVNDAVSCIKEDDPQFSILLEDSLDTSTASSALDNVPTTPADNPQLNRPIPKPSDTSARPRRQRNGLGTSTDSVEMDPLAYSASPSFLRKRPAAVSPTQPIKRACQTATRLENRSRRRPRGGREKDTARRRLECCETGGNTTAPSDILAQSTDFHSDKTSHSSQSTSGMGVAASGEDLTSSQASIGDGDLASTFALLPSSTPVASQAMGCTAAPISGVSASKDASELACTSNASSQSTPSFVPSMASPHDSSEDDDELPAFNPGAQDDQRKTYIPAENELVWVKFGRFPFWPALVCSCQKKRKKKLVVNVFFLGYDEYCPVGIKNLRNIRRYDSTNNKIYMLEAQKSNKEEKEQIQQAAHEADQIIHLRLTKEIHGSPWEQFSEIVKRRPKPRAQVSSLSPTALPQESQPLSATDHRPLTPAATHYRSDPGDQGEEAHNSSNDETGSEFEGEEVLEEQEESSSLYTFERLQNYFISIKLTLQEICCGKEQSDLHDIFHHGKRKEQSSLRLLEKFGPAQNMPATKKSDLLRILEQLTEPVTRRKNNFVYTYDVLLPEAIARSIAKFEGCSLDAAWTKLETYQ